MKEYERLKSPKNKGLQGFARIANGAKVVPYDENVTVTYEFVERYGSP